MDKRVSERSQSKPELIPVIYGCSLLLSLREEVFKLLWKFIRIYICGHMEFVSFYIYYLFYVDFFN